MRYVIPILFLASVAFAAPVKVSITIPSLGLANVTATIDGLGTKISEYPNVAQLQTNYLFVIADQPNRTNYCFSYNQLLEQMSTELKYRYTTNAIPTNGVLTFAKSYTTNLTSNITLPPFSISGNAFYETLVLQITNGDNATHTITFPSGCIAAPGESLPPVIYCTNGTQKIILVSHFGLTYTNVWDQPFAQ